jgi:hypothetical protein
VKAPNFKLEQAKAVIGTSRAVGKMAWMRICSISSSTD